MSVSPQLAARRRAVHAAARQLHMQDDDRRALIAGVAGGKTSTTELDVTECDRVLDRLRALGAARARPDGKPVRFLGRHPGHPETCRRECEARMTKVEAFLADMKLPWSYAKSILRQQHRTERLEWATEDQLDGVIAALAVEQEKRHLLSLLDARLAETCRDRADAQAWVDANALAKSATWTRHRKTLQQLLDWLDAGIRQ